MSQVAEIARLIKAALECTLYLSPETIGLTHDEIVELCGRLDYRAGEISDALKLVNSVGSEGKRWGLSHDTMMKWTHIFLVEEPSLINFDALDFVISQLQESARNVGAAQAGIDKAVSIERGVQAGIPENDMRVAVKLLLISERLAGSDGVLKFPRGQVTETLPSQQARRFTPGEPHKRPELQRVLPIVRDLIARRSDGRPQRTAPLQAFSDALTSLGYGPFRLWWTQVVAELERTDVEASPLSALVLSAALVEGGLVFVVKRARSLNVGPFGSSDFADDPRRWKLEDLVNSAARGGPAAILDQNVRNRADTLIRTRQRIHAGRMLSEYPTGVPDLRPDEARDAKATAELVVRRILDWIEAHPATT